ncbi:MAG: MarR family transcriptional regulator, partial [Myxococcales bacterium]|nr:MarR family transcriptional regulator [Myxococcales bacterium]
MPDPAPDFRADLEAAKRASVAQLLFRCARQWNELAIQRIRVMTGQELLRPSHMALFPHIDLEGTRQVELARRLGISKQAVGIMIADLEAMGVVERVADPRDRRAKLICFSEAGRAGLM